MYEISFSNWIPIQQWGGGQTRVYYVYQFKEFIIAPLPVYISFYFQYFFFQTIFYYSLKMHPYLIYIYLTFNISLFIQYYTTL